MVRSSEIAEKAWNKSVCGKSLNKVTSDYLKTLGYRKCRDRRVLQQLKEDVCRQTIGETELTRETQLKMILDGSLTISDCDPEMEGQEMFYDSKKFITQKKKLRESYLPQVIMWTDPGAAEGARKLPLKIDCNVLR